MITLTIKKIADDGSVASESNLQFSNDAQFKTEILTTLMKVQEFSCGSVVWIDSGCTSKRQMLRGITRPLACPILRKNSGYTEQVSDKLFFIMTESELVIRNANMEKFTVSYTKTNESSSTRESSRVEHSGENEASCNNTCVKPISTARKVSSKEDMFATVEGYVPARVNKNL